MEVICYTVNTCQPLYSPLLHQLPGRRTKEGGSLLGSLLNDDWRVPAAVSWKMTTSFFITIWEQFQDSKSHWLPKFVFLRRLCCKLPFPMGQSTLRILQAILIAKTSKYTESWDKAGLWQCLGLLEACLSPPVPRDHEEQALLSCYSSCLTSLFRSHHLSFLGTWVLTSLILGVRDPASGSLYPRILHATWSLLSSGTRTRCCCLPKCFPMGYVQEGLSSPWETWCCPLGPERGFQLGARGLVLLFLAVAFLNSPLRQPSRDWSWRLSWLSWLDLSF